MKCLYLTGVAEVGDRVRVSWREDFQQMRGITCTTGILQLKDYGYDLGPFLVSDDPKEMAWFQAATEPYNFVVVEVIEKNATLPSYYTD
jgi:hypothetical protein